MITAMDDIIMNGYSPTLSPDLMPLETPLLRVSRPVAACSRCRSAKVKCDGKLPACTACERAGRAASCSSANDQFARGKERSYVVTLEAQVEKLERRLREAQARRKSSVTMTDANQAALRARQQSIAAGGRAARRKEASNIDDLVSDFGYLSVNATARDFYGFTSAMSYARLILASSSKEALPSGMAKVLPQRFIATPLIQHYLNNIFVFLPLFDETSFYRSVDLVYHTDPQLAQPFDHWTVRMVLAIASASMSRQRGDTESLDAVGHVNAAMEFAEDVIRPGSIAGIQALILLVEYARLAPHHFDSWILIGAASRAMVDFGLHQDPKTSSIKKDKLELRRRVFYCVYVLDRDISFVEQRALSFSDDSAKVALPFGGSGGAFASFQQTSPSPFLQTTQAAKDCFRFYELKSQCYTELFQRGPYPLKRPNVHVWGWYNRFQRWFANLSPEHPALTRMTFELELLHMYVAVLFATPASPRVTQYAHFVLVEHAAAYAQKWLRVVSERSAQLLVQDAIAVRKASATALRLLQSVYDFDVLIRSSSGAAGGAAPGAASTAAAAAGAAVGAVDAAAFYSRQSVENARSAMMHTLRAESMDESLADPEGLLEPLASGPNPAPPVEVPPFPAVVPALAASPAAAAAAAAPSAASPPAATPSRILDVVNQFKAVVAHLAQRLGCSREVLGEFEARTEPLLRALGAIGAVVGPVRPVGGPGLGLGHGVQGGVQVFGGGGPLVEVELGHVMGGLPFVR
ncbi:fungal-specific transcription factor domain-containing protein [Lineolata rhizophorae]|uniref:Fungal-specific transcription factor domain-containing protein n=1 Tax=Lineolata rhizophorae TaxID=578093 RepID=A0A6A6P4T6_9PEZI|nr:fungal-specific transcription factor domain-containing protein [Lineolata rhizophorae]